MSEPFLVPIVESVSEAISTHPIASSTVAGFSLTELVEHYKDIEGAVKTAYKAGMSLEQRVQERLRRHTGAPPAKRAKKSDGFTRTVGNYGRYGGGYNNPENRTKENKYFDTTIGVNITSTGSVPGTGGQLALVPQGTAANRRIGQKITIHSIQLRGNCHFDADSTATASGGAIVYIYVVQDTQCNGAAAGVTDVMTSSDFKLAMINMSNSSRFRIVKRFVFEMNSNGYREAATSTWQIPTKEVEWFKKCRIPMEFSSTTGAITEIKSNNLFLLTQCSAAAGGRFDGTCRIRFSD